LTAVATTATSVVQICIEAKRAARQLAQLETERKNDALDRVSGLLENRASQVLEANAADVEEARSGDHDAAFVDKLTLDEARVGAMAEGVRAVAALPDPVGEVIETRRLRSGLEMKQVRVPIGVIALVYEARPNVTVDAAALCLKSGNAVVLRGSSAAERSNAALAAVVAEACADAGLPQGSVALVAGGGHEQMRELATQEDLVDLIIPRGGEGLKVALREVATVPVIYAAAGNCHVYVHEDADLEMARRIAYNAKVQRPGVCNAAETLLVHLAVAEQLLPGLLAELSEAGVEILGDERARASAGETPVGEAIEEDWKTEYLGLKMAVGVVDSLEDAVEHVNAHGTAHSEAIVTSSDQAAEAFTSGVDAAAVYVNASTRFTDGFEFGMGAEMGNSTQKLHARGPIGLRELTTTKYVLRGSGQVRE
jgi:glutamate-5-semialdehyde dehydrogenase